jgi:hypothetical protein
MPQRSNQQPGHENSNLDLRGSLNGPSVLFDKNRAQRESQRLNRFARHRTSALEAANLHCVSGSRVCIAPGYAGSASVACPNLSHVPQQCLVMCEPEGAEGERLVIAQQVRTIGLRKVLRTDRYVLKTACLPHPPIPANVSHC